MKFLTVLFLAASLLPKPTPDPPEVFWIAKTVCREFGGVDDLQSLYCANVILNRVKSKQFPNTVRAVLEQPGQYGDLNVDALDWPGWAKAKDAKLWRDRCLDYARRIWSGERLLPRDVLYQAEFRQGTGVFAKFRNYAKTGYTYFCYG